MPNIREINKKNRITKLGKLIESIKSESREIDIKKLCSMMIVEHGISKKTAMEEIEAVIDYEN